MLLIPKTSDYLKILTDDELKNFVDINFGNYLKSAKEKMYSKLIEKTES